MALRNPFKRNYPVLKHREDEVKTFLRNKLAGQAPTIADALELPPARLRSYYERDRVSRYFPAALVRPLFIATGCDREVADEFLLHGTEYTLRRVDDASGPAPSSKPATLSRAIVELGDMKGRIDKLYLEATSEHSDDGTRISPVENDDLRAALQALIERAENLRLELKRTRTT